MINTNTETEDLIAQLNEEDSVKLNCYNIIKRTVPFSDEQETEFLAYFEYLLEHRILFDIDLSEINIVDVCYYYLKTS